MSTKTEKMLERVRALIAKADSTEFEGEADSFRAKADQIMAQYAIEQWMVDEAQKGSTERPKPEVRTFNFDWWYRHPQSSQLWWMFGDVARHCRCVVALRGHGTREAGGDYKKMPVIGLSSDLDWFDMLFTSLMLQMSRNLTPDVDPAAEPGKNVYTMRMAGMGWKEITRRMWVARQATPLRKGIASRRWDYSAGAYVNETEQHTLEDDFSTLSEAYWTGVKNNLANLNRRYVKENGLPRNYVNPAVYQRSYADGFVNRIDERLRRMRRDDGGSGDTGSTAIVLRDIYQNAVSLYNEMWPAPEPVASKGKKRKSTAVARERAYSYEAANHGAAAADRADLSNSPGQRIGSRRQLPEG
jgi:hypothetical protein